MGAETITDAESLEPFVEQAIKAGEKAVADYLKGKEAALGALVGQVMKLTRGKADPKLAAELLRRRLEALRGEK
jgi:aspartyl-tRNA(Asn)/glutamyl-tRNA(Gln) amidotransferase subunit B